MSELKCCPFCGSQEIKKPTGDHGYLCNQCSAEMFSDWNARPLEDSLRERVEKAEAELLHERVEKAEAKLKREQEQKQEYVELKQELEQRLENAALIVSEQDAKTDKDAQELEALDYLRNRFGRGGEK